MGTRCLTVITSSWPEQEPEHHATIYRHWDGYLVGGQGEDLYKILEKVIVTNGVLCGEEHNDDFIRINGPGRLAAHVVCEMQKNGDEPDLCPEGSVCGQEYVYKVHCYFGMGGGDLVVEVIDGPVTAFGGGGDRCTNSIFVGTVKEFGECLTREKEKASIE